MEKYESNLDTSIEENNEIISLKKLVFLNGILAISLLRFPWIILAFLCVVVIEYFVLNHYWQKPKASILTSLLGNIYSSVLLVPLLFLPFLTESLLVMPASLSNALTRLILYENISIDEFIFELAFGLLLALLIVLMLFTIPFILTILIERIVGYLLYVPKDNAIIVSNMITYGAIIIVMVILGILVGFINPTDIFIEAIGDTIFISIPEEVMSFSITGIVEFYGIPITVYVLFLLVPLPFLLYPFYQRTESLHIYKKFRNSLTKDTDDQVVHDVTISENPNDKPKCKRVTYD